VAVGGTGGSGTRVMAEALEHLGLDLGPELNRARDNLWFTLLFKRPRWLPAHLADADDAALDRGLSIFARAMTARFRPGPADLGYLARATAELAAGGHDAGGSGRGTDAVALAGRLLRSGRRARAPRPWAWKEPATALLVAPLRRRFPHLRYVHVMRHGLDWALAPDQADVATWGPPLGLTGPAPRSPAEQLRYWLAVNEEALRTGRRLYGEALLVVRLEDLCHDPRAGFEALVAFLGLDPDPSVMDALCRLPSVPPSAGAHRRADLSQFDPADVERVRALGFPIGEATPRTSSARRATGRGPTVSVALCTYQGERFLPVQLETLAAQTRPPDELVVGDDGSTDATPELLERFAEQVPFPVRVHVNGERLGSSQNFAATMGRCTGDVIFLCDQDDAWHAGKIERLLLRMAEPDHPALVFSDADLIDEGSHSVGPGLWEATGFAGSLKERFAAGQVAEVLCVGNVVTGAASAFEARYRDLILPVPPGWVHDAWIALVMAGTAAVAMVPEPLLRYRIHGDQQIGVPTTLTRREHLERRAQLVRRIKKQERDLLHQQAQGYTEAVARIRARAERFPPRPDALAYFEGKIRHLDSRASMETRTVAQRGSVVAAEALTGRYHRFSNGWSSVAKDLTLSDRVLARRGPRDG